MCDRLFHSFITWVGSLVFLILSQTIVWADTSIKQIVSTSPSWGTFTNRDGSGLYHEILGAIFTPLGIQVVHRYTNANRGLHTVEKDLADFYICKNEIDDFPGLTLARYPMYEGRFHAIFKKVRVKDWQGAASLANRKVVWRRGYYKASEFEVKLVVFEADSGISALNQVILGRLDFYIDDLNLIRDSIAQYKNVFDMNDYRIEPVGSRRYYPVFKVSSRGKTIMAFYDKGMERLHSSGELKTLFEKWSHPYPDYDISQ